MTSVERDVIAILVQRLGGRVTISARDLDHPPTRLTRLECHDRDAFVLEVPAARFEIGDNPALRRIAR